jgi:hypothetical protein
LSALPPDFPIDVGVAPDLLAPVDERGVDAETVEDAGELDRYVAAADDHDRLRQPLQVERLVRVDRVLDAGDRRHDRPAAGRDQYVAGRDRAAVLLEAHGVRALDGGTGGDDLDLRALEVGAVGLLEAVDLLVLVRDELRPVERRTCTGGRHRPAEPGRVLELAVEPAGVDEQLLRHTAADHARAADTVLLRDRDAGAMVGRDACRPHTARARSDDK